MTRQQTQSTPGYRLSRGAELDLANVLDYTVDTWGGKQADRYLEGFVECFVRIAQRPLLGRACESVGPGVRRIEQGKHVVFYKHNEDVVYIVRILHQRMLPKRHEMMEGNS